MKKKFIIVLLITVVGSLSLMAQTRRRTVKKPVKKTTQTVKPDTAKAANTAAALPPAAVLDSMKAVPDSDDGYLKSIVMTQARPFQIFEPSANNIKMYHEYKRELLFKDPRNAKFNTSGSTLIEAILQGIQDGIITPYDANPVPKINPSGDAFTRQMTYKQLMNAMLETVKKESFDANGNVTGTSFVKNDFSPDRVVGYRIKEDVYYDKQRAKVETKIIGIAPLIMEKGSNGDTLGRVAVCWLKYKQCRIVFAKMDVSDADKNMYDVSMDDMFLQRQFNAPIIYESNPRGERIHDYIKGGPDAEAKEAARIEKKLDDYKNNIWKYQTDRVAIAVPDKVKSKKAPAPTPVKPKTTPAATPDNNTGTPVKP